jgi:ubiquitin carboxyl-terminal hydrolase L3
LKPSERALILENSAELESKYTTAARGGDTVAPTDAEAEVDFHFVCFVNSNKSARIYELDGDRKCPIDKGISLVSGDDMLSEAGLSIVKEFMKLEGGGSANFSLMALVHTS